MQPPSAHNPITRHLAADDMHLWRRRRNDWLSDATHLLEAFHGPAAARAVNVAAHVGAPSSSWERALPEESERLSSALLVMREFAFDGLP
jgi:hypothetical protein